MFKRKFYLTFLLMFIATLILTTMTSDADEELYAQRRSNRSRRYTTRRSNTRKSQGYPSWVKWTWRYKIINDNGQKKFKIDITYRNNSRDKIMKSIFNKTLTLSFKQCEEAYYGGDIKYKGRAYKTITNCRGHLTSTRVNSCKLYPGESYTLTYYMPFNKFNWRLKYSSKHHKLLNFKLSHKFQVQKQNMDVD